MIFIRKFYIHLLIVSVSLISCDNAEKNVSNPTLFTKIPEDKSNIIFTNEVIQNQGFNLFKWKYIYNGAGVATGDINNDGLVDIYLVSNTGPNKLFLNKGDFSFKDITNSSGISAMGGYKTGVAMVDLNGDGLLDIFVCRDANEKPSLRNNLLFINNGDSTFTQKNKEWNLLDESYTTQALFFDYDKDWDLDLVLINHPYDFDNSLKFRKSNNPIDAGKRITTPTSDYTRIKFYENMGNKFEEKTSELGINHESFGLGGIVADFNNDGWQDFFIANDFLEPDFLFINEKGKSFKESAAMYFKHMSQNSMGVDFQDINNDGFGDLVVLDMLAESNQRQKSFATSMSINQYESWVKNGYWKQIMRNMLFLNDSKGQFSEIGMLAGIHKTDWSWSPVIRDFNMDGKNDIFISNGILKDMSDKDFIVYLSDSISKARNKGIEALTANNYKQWIDKIPSTPLPNKLFLGTDRIKYEDIDPSKSGLSDSTFSQGVSVADFDNDGDLDLIINNTEQNALLYQNNLDTADFLKVKLVGKGLNLNAIGSKITLHTGSKKQSFWVHSTSGFMSSQDQTISFAVESKQPDSIVVIWPDNSLQTVRQIKMSELNLIKYQPQLTDIKSEYFKPFFKNSGILEKEFLHKKSGYNEFKTDPLLIKAFGNLGPDIAVGDINNDSLDDFYVTGGQDQAGMLYIQTKNGFRIVENNSFKKNAKFDEVSCVFFDYDNDEDLDLYTVSGGNWSINIEDYQDHLYENNGKGLFIEMSLSVLNERKSGTKVKVVDIDKDGDLDLIISNQKISLLPELSNTTYILQNTPKGLEYKEIDFASNWNDFVSVDINNDDKPDLLGLGHWTSPEVLIQSDNLDFRKFKIFRSDSLKGLWKTIEAIDFDNDGDMDFFLGNEGSNIPNEIALNQPLTEYIGDFDQNGIDEFIYSYVEDESEWVYSRKEVLGSKLPLLNKKFVSYKSYANASIEEVFGLQPLKEAQSRMVNEVNSGVLVNNNGQLYFSQLEDIAQIAPIYDIIQIENMVLMVGNFEQNDVEIGPYDASNGLIYNLDSKTYISLDQELFGGFVRNVKPINFNSKTHYLIASNNGNFIIAELNQ